MAQALAAVLRWPLGLLHQAFPPEVVLTVAWMLPLGALWGCAFSLRLLFVPIWTTYVPVISPAFGTGPGWASSQQQAYAARGHIISFVLSLACGVLQLDKSLRASRPQLHRRMRWLHVASGLVMVATLRPLRATGGGFARPGDGPSVATMHFIDAVSVAWLASAGAALFYATVRGDFATYLKWTATSVALAMAPLAANCMLMALVPCVMAARLVLDAAVHDVPFWRSAWGAAPDAWGTPAEPAVLSLEGYGVAENLVLPWAAWLGLLEVLYFIHIAAWSPEPPGAESLEETADAEEAPAEAAPLPSARVGARGPVAQNFGKMMGQFAAKEQNGVGVLDTRIVDVGLADALRHLWKMIPSAFVGSFGRIEPKEVLLRLRELLLRAARRCDAPSGKGRSRTPCALAAEVACRACWAAAALVCGAAALVMIPVGVAMAAWLFTGAVTAAGSGAAFSVQLARGKLVPLLGAGNGTAPA